MNINTRHPITNHQIFGLGYPNNFREQTLISRIMELASNFFRAISSFFSSICHGFRERIQLITDSYIPFPQKVFALTWGVHEIIANMQSSDKEMIIKAIKEAPEDRRVALIETLANIPTRERAELITSANDIAPDCNGRDKIALIETLANIPTREREQFLAYAITFIDPEMSSYTKEKIIAALANIPARERAGLITSVNDIAPDCNGRDKIALIETLANIPAGKREEEKEQINRFAQTLITPQMSLSKRGAIIAAVAKVSREERETVIAHTQKLIRKTGATATNYFVDKMDEIAKLHPDQRDEFVENRGVVTLAQRRARVKELEALITGHRKS